MKHALTKLRDDIYDALTVPCVKSKTVFFVFVFFCFAFSIMKNTVAPSARFIIPGKLICCIAFASALSACCLLKSIAFNL